MDTNQRHGSWKICIKKQVVTNRIFAMISKLNDGQNYETLLKYEEDYIFCAQCKKGVL
jgi:hypothetical protein